MVGGFQKGDTDLQAAMQSYREGIALARRSGHRGRLMALINNIGYTGFLVGEWDDALAEMEKALLDELDYKDRMSIMCNAAIVHAARGEPIDDTLSEVMQLGEKLPSQTWRMVYLDPTGNRALAQGDAEEARAAWHRLAELDPSQANEFVYRAAVADAWATDRALLEGDLEELDATGVHGHVATARRLSRGGRTGLSRGDGRRKPLRSSARRSPPGASCGSHGTRR